MRVLFAPRALLPAYLLALFIPSGTFAGQAENAKIAIHVKAVPAKVGTTCSSWAPTTPCSQYNTSGRVGIEQYVYLVVGNASRAGVLAAEFGIDYDPIEYEGIDVHAWTLCASTSLILPGANGNWPSAGSGIRALWNTCQSNWIEPNGVHAIIGALSVYAYSEDTLRVTELGPLFPGDGCTRKHAISVLECDGSSGSLLVGPLSYAFFTASGDAPGYNPCPSIARAYPVVTRNSDILSQCQVADTVYTVQKLTNGGTAPLVGNIVALGLDYSITSGGGAYALESGQSREVIARLLPSSLGLKRGQIAFSDEWPPIELWGMAVCADSAELVASPTFLDFGDVTVGSSRELLVRVSNLSNCSGALAGPLLGGNGVFVSCSAIPTVVDPLQAIEVPISFAPVNVGIRTEGIVIDSSTLKFLLPGQTEPLSISVRGRGVLAPPVVNVPADRAWFEPGTTNTVARGRWLKAMIELPVPYSPDQIRIASVTAFDSIPADSTFFEVADTDSNGVPEGAVRFSRPSLLQYAYSSPESLIVPVRGELEDKAVFTARPKLRIIHLPLIHPRAGDALIGGSFVPVSWDAPGSWEVDHAIISFSPDGGSQWMETGQVTGAQSYMWHVPVQETSMAKIRVALYDAFGLLIFGDTGEFGISQTIGVGPSGLEPARLYQNSPNPFSLGTRIDFTTRQNSRVVLQIFDVRGRLVRVLRDETIAAGSHGMYWDGRDSAGRNVSDGVYLYHLKAAGLNQTRRMLKVGK